MDNCKLRDQALYPSRLKVDTILSETQRFFFVEKTLTLVSLVSFLKILAQERDFKILAQVRGFKILAQVRGFKILAQVRGFA